MNGNSNDAVNNFGNTLVCKLIKIVFFRFSLSRMQYIYPKAKIDKK